MAYPAVEDLLPGQTLKVSTVLGETLEGFLLAYDKQTQSLLLQQTASASSSTAAGSARTVTFLLHAGIKQVTVTNKELTETVSGRNILVPPRFDLQSLASKEDSAVKKVEEESLLLKRGVSREALDLHFALSKTLPVSWEGTTILVLGEIRITSPYEPQSVTGGNAAARERVKMVLMKEKERLRQQ